MRALLLAAAVLAQVQGSTPSPAPAPAPPAPTIEKDTGVAVTTVASTTVVSVGMGILVVLLAAIRLVPPAICKAMASWDELHAQPLKKTDDKQQAEIDGIKTEVAALKQLQEHLLAELKAARPVNP